MAPAVDLDKEKIIYAPGYDPDARPAATLAIVTHYTHEPYHRYRIPVVELCVSSMRAGVGAHGCELIIFDNGSTPDFKKKLRTFAPDVLVLSPNVGKQSAQQRMVELARGDVFCFSDDDVYHYPGWLDKHLEVLNTYPSPALVSGSPQRTATRWGVTTNNWFAQRHPGIMKVGRFLSDESERMYARSIGRNEKAHITDTLGVDDCLFTYRGVKAWAYAHHMQFVTRRQDIIGILPPSMWLIDHGGEWDRYMDMRKFLRLTTYTRCCLHIGNELGGDVLITKEG